MIQIVNSSFSSHPPQQTRGHPQFRLTSFPSIPVLFCPTLFNPIRFRSTTAPISRREAGTGAGILPYEELVSTGLQNHQSQWAVPSEEFRSRKEAQLQTYGTKYTKPTSNTLLGNACIVIG